MLKDNSLDYRNTNGFTIFVRRNFRRYGHVNEVKYNNKMIK